MATKRNTETYPLTAIAGAYLAVPPYVAGFNGNAFIADRVYLWRILLEVPMTFDRVSIDITTAAGSSNWSGVVYNVDGTIKLIDSGLISSAATGITTGSFTPVTLNPDVYLFGITCSSSSVVARGMQPNSFYYNWINANTMVVGRATNTATAGVPPATTGTLISAAVDIPAVKWHKS